MDLKQRIADELDGARQRSTALLAPLTEEQLTGQHSPLMSPLAWDLAHIGNYEDQWLVRALGAPGLGDRYDEMYDAFRHPRRARSALPLLGPDAARAYIGAVRDRALDRLDRAYLSPEVPEPLLRHGFVYGMVVQHEHQHDETMLAALQLMGRPDVLPARPSAAIGRSPAQDEVLVPAGPFTMGAVADPWAYDNERPAHVVDVPAFFIDTTAVTNAAYAEFVREGGYDDPRWWTAEGWKWRQEASLQHPQFWVRDGDGWLRDRFGRVEPLPADEPVQHVCWYEADAYARWRGKRLPTEAEWEKAAAWDPTTGRTSRYPWGDASPGAEHANLGGRHDGPAPVGAYPAGASPVGCLGMVGDVWEWTASDFAPYPGFHAFPYREYSEVFFGPEHKVLRGGSWATHPSAVRTTFRNWDYPVRRQIFAGFRCARSV
ncbi:MAG: ergothioneine biosynthesis protein EgtB [Actinomycetota bacterium]|nr:ergothioneine biosynthesis protein EgtB [Actinomycetota bacterium]